MPAAGAAGPTTVRLETAQLLLQQRQPSHSAPPLPALQRTGRK